MERITLICKTCGAECRLEVDTDFDEPQAEICYCAVTGESAEWEVDDEV